MELIAVESDTYMFCVQAVLHPFCQTDSPGKDTAIVDVVRDDFRFDFALLF